MLMGQLILAALLMVAATPESVVLTPDTMAENGFHIEGVLFDPTADNAARSKQSRGLVLLRVHFDPVKGPAIETAKSASLVVRGGDAVLLNVPVQLAPYAGNRGGLWVRFWTQRDLQMLPNTHLVLDGVSGTFTVDLKAFIEKK